MFATLELIVQLTLFCIFFFGTPFLVAKLLEQKEEYNNGTRR